MIVDDERDVLNVTATVLAGPFAAHETIATQSPAEAIRILGEREIAVLLCDLSMPQIDGTTVLRHAFEANPNTVSLLITGRATKDSLITAMNEGNVWRCIEKPWTMDKLVGIVQEALDEYEKRAREEPASQPAHKPRKQVFLHKSPRKVIVQPRTPPPQPAVAEQRPEARLFNERYQNITFLKEGGSGSIYKAFDIILGLPVAIKFVHAQFSENREYASMLLNEARIAMQLSHKHIVRLHNIEQTGGRYYLVMEYIDGCTLRTMLRENGSFPVETVAQIMDVCEDALGYAHRKQVYHRDLKPDNLMLDNDGILKLIDFGTACLAVQSVKNRDYAVGTPYYMSPEEQLGKPLDQRTDIYSMGVMLHEFIMGSLPPYNPNETDVVEYRPIPSPSLPAPIREVLWKSFTFEPVERWPDIHQMAAAFRKALAESGVSAPAATEEAAPASPASHTRKTVVTTQPGTEPGAASRPVTRKFFRN